MRLKARSPSDKLSITELAGRAGVSAATVSRVLNDRPGIKLETRRRVLDAAHKSGFRPRVATRTITVGIVVDYVAGEFGVGEVDALATGSATALANLDVAIEIFAAGHVESLPRRFLDGIIAIAWKPATLAALQHLKNVPIVIYNRAELGLFSCVTLDDFQVGYRAAKHLIENGHRRIGYIANQQDYETTRRIEGFQHAAAEAGITLNEDSIAMTHFRPALTTLRRAVEQNITGLFVAQTQLTQEIAYLASEGLRLSIPRDLSLIGLGMERTMQYYRPPMTLIAPPIDQLTETAVKMLKAQMTTGDRTLHVETVMPKLIRRDSVARPPV